MIKPLMKGAVLIALPLFIAMPVIAQDPIHQVPAMPTQPVSAAMFNDTMNAIAFGRSAAHAVPVGGLVLGGFIGTPWTVVSALAFAHGSKPNVTMAIGPAVFLGAIGMMHGSKSALPVNLRARVQDHDSAFVATFKRSYDQALSKRQGEAFALGSLAGTVAGVLFFFFVVGPALAT